MTFDLDMALVRRAPEAGDICRARLDEYGVPVALHEGLVRYLVDGLRPGAFLCAVLENDLREAVLRANPDENLWALPQLLRFLFNEVPARASGSPELVAAWVAERCSEAA